MFIFAELKVNLKVIMLDISKLISVGESVAYDDQLGFAEMISKPVCDITVGDMVYEIRVEAKLKNPKHD